MWNKDFLTTLAFLLLTATMTAADISKRSDDTNPLTAVVEQLTAKIADLEARQSADETRLTSLEQRVSFKAQFSPTTVTPPKTAPFKFDNVVFNDGNDYDPLLGVFTAPLGGIYTFSCQIFTHITERPLIDIKVNGNIVSRMGFYATSDSTQQSDITTVIVKLSSGDKVWVEPTIELDIIGTVHSFFTGALLYAN